MTAPADNLADIVAASMIAALPAPVTALADHIAADHGDGILAILAYGSCLREVRPDEGLIDYYVLTRDFPAVSPNPLSRWGCRLVPPNVYYAQADCAGGTYRAKYAVLPLDQFAARVSRRTVNPYFWARFAQPCAIVRVADEATRQTVLAILTDACRTAYGNFAAVAGADDRPLALWRRGFALTYATELRPESAGRADDIVSAHADYYRAITEVLRITAPAPGSSALGSTTRLAGKLLSAARLIKAAFTFQGGADYIAWKIARHSGHTIELTPWQRNHPLLAAITLLPKLLKSGAVR